VLEAKVFVTKKGLLEPIKSKGKTMKKIILFFVAIAMTTLFVHANIESPTTTTALETEVPVPTDGDTNGTTEEAAPRR